MMDAASLQRMDFACLTDNLGNNRAVLVKLLDLFMASARQSIEQMSRAERETNILLWLQQAHHLKGACQNITAKRLAKLCNEAEEITSLPHEQSGAVLYHMQKELALLNATIEGYLDK